jgi:hypothetical protein
VAGVSLVPLGNGRDRGRRRRGRLGKWLALVLGFLEAGQIKVSRVLNWDEDTTLTRYEYVFCAGDPMARKGDDNLAHGLPCETQFYCVGP